MFFCDCMVSWLMGFGCGVSGLLHFKFLGLYGFVVVCFLRCSFSFRDSEFDWFSSFLWFWGF